jgi:peptidoglycan/LPS O-acetylase OafA/YrhL
MNKNVSLSNDTSYLEQLTWLRGIAAFFVVISHVIRSTEVNYLSQSNYTISPILYSLDLGTFGVLLFFTLSGTTLYISHTNKSVPISQFYIKRFFRIWPAFAVSLLLYALFQPVFLSLYPELQGFWIEHQFITNYSVKDIMQYLLLISNINGNMGLFNNAYWSLPVEFQYYIIFPLLIITLKYLNVLGPILVGLCLYLIYKLDLSHFVDTKVFMLGFSFCGGVIIGHIYIQLKNKNVFLTPSIGTSILLISFIVASLITNKIIALPNIPIISGIWNWYIGLSFIAVISVLFSKINIPHMFQLVLKLSGNISYSAYLYHNVVIAILILLCIQLSIANELQLLIVLLGTLFGTYYIANFSFIHIEKKGMALGKYICAYLDGKTKKVN